MTDALKAAREVLARWKSGGPRPAHASRQELAGALRTALAEVDRLIADNENDKMKALLYRAYNSPEPEARQAAFRDAMQRADLAEAEIDRLAASEKRLREALLASRDYCEAQFASQYDRDMMIQRIDGALKP